MSPVLNAATGWLLYAGLALVLGSTAARAFIMPRSGCDTHLEHVALRRAAAKQGLAGASILCVALGLVFLRQLQEFRDPFVPWTEDARLLLAATEWGTTWTIGMVGALLVLVCFALGAAEKSLGHWWGGIAALAMGSFPAFTGHANGSGPLRPLTLGADTLHVWAAGAWLGGLAFVLLAERGWRTERVGQPASLLPFLVPALSPLAILCVGTLVVTGAGAAWIHVSSLSELLTSVYGRRLLVKLVVVAFVFTVGFVNWRVLTPRLTVERDNRTLRRAALVELLAAQIVLIVTAVLVRSPPPMP